MITVFIGSTNRIETLERTIASYQHLTHPHEIVIVDNGTDHPDCIDVLDRLETQVKKIYRLPACDSMEEATDNFNVAVRDQYDTDGGEWFAVSEADVCFDGAPADALDVYLEVARVEGTAVGCHLRADGSIPVCYPLRSRVLACETWPQYRRDMQMLEMESLAPVFYNKCQIDTTFHLFQRTRHFDRLNLNPIRVGGEYAAHHLDWHLDVFAPNRENPIYVNGPRKVGSWGKEWIRDYWNWFQEDGAEKAFERLSAEPRNPRDLCNVAFMLSWCRQYGVGCEQDFGESRWCLREAIPYPNPRYWDLEDDWMGAIYHDDHDFLGVAA